MLVTSIFFFFHTVFFFFNPITDRNHHLSNINFVVCKCSQFGGKILSSGKELTLYHTIPTFDNPENEAFRKLCGKKGKMLVTSIFFISHNVYYHPEKNFCFKVTFILSSANAFHLTSLNLVIQYRVMPPFTRARLSVSVYPEYNST